MTQPQGWRGREWGTSPALTLAEIRRRLGLDRNDLDPFWLREQRIIYARGRHAPLTWIDLGGERRVFTVDDAIAWANQRMAE